MAYNDGNFQVKNWQSVCDALQISIRCAQLMNVGLDISNDDHKALFRALNDFEKEAVELHVKIQKAATKVFWGDK